jgi:AcrR family transcriptional regulator
MTLTPWGDAERLRDRMLPPGPSTPRAVVRANQRERLYAAMVAVVDRKGYEETTVADLVELSGVSRSDFYEHFANKEECYLATFAAIDDLLAERIAAAWDGPGGWDARLRLALERFAELVVEQPAAARLCLVELYVVGPAAARLQEERLARYVRVIVGICSESPERAELAPEVIRGVLGGLRRVVHGRLRRDEQDVLPALLPDLWRWALCYRTPPQPLRPRRMRSAPAGRARYVPNDQVERLFAALAGAVAEKGYAKVTVAEIVAGAGTSLSTFYAHFDNKQEAFLAAFDAGAAQVQAAVEPTSRRAPDWQHAVHDGLRAQLTYLSVETGWAHLGVVAALAGGPVALDRLDEAMELLERLLEPGYELSADASPLYGEAIAGAIYALMYDQIQRRGAVRLPELLSYASFIALAPFIGASEAQAVANDAARPRRARAR